MRENGTTPFVLSYHARGWRQGGRHLHLSRRPPSDRTADFVGANSTRCQTGRFNVRGKFAVENGERKNQNLSVRPFDKLRAGSERRRRTPRVFQQREKIQPSRVAEARCSTIDIRRVLRVQASDNTHDRRTVRGDRS